MKLLKGGLALLGAGMFLVTTYLVVTFIVRHPYKGAKTLRVNSIFSAMQDPSGVFFIKGWSYSEGTHRWTDGKIAKLAFSIEDNNEHDKSCSQKVLNLYPIMVIDSCQSLSININEKYLLNYLLCETDTIISIPLPGEIVNYDKTNLLTIAIGAPRVPSDFDKRLLGFAINKYSVQCR